MSSSPYRSIVIHILQQTCAISSGVGGERGWVGETEPYLNSAGFSTHLCLLQMAYIGDARCSWDLFAYLLSLLEPALAESIRARKQEMDGGVVALLSHRGTWVGYVRTYCTCMYSTYGTVGTVHTYVLLLPTLVTLVTSLLISNNLLFYIV